MVFHRVFHRVFHSRVFYFLWFSRGLDRLGDVLLIFGLTKLGLSVIYVVNWFLGFLSKSKKSIHKKNRND